MLLDRKIGAVDALCFLVAQLIGALVGVLIAHAMFGLELLQVSARQRTGPAQWFSEAIATFGLVFFIVLTVARRPKAVAAVVGFYITAAYWFTASTSFANPAVTIARSFTDTFSGIRPADMPTFIAAQRVGAVLAVYLARHFTPNRSNSSV